MSDVIEWAEGFLKQTVTVFTNSVSTCVDLEQHREAMKIIRALVNELTAAEKMVVKDHEIAQLVNDLTRIAKEYAGTQSIRGRISRCIIKALATYKEKRE